MTALEKLWVCEPDAGLVIPVAELTRTELLALWAVGARLVAADAAEQLAREWERADLARRLEEAGRWN